MKEYLNNPDATARTLRDGWLYTGDNVVMDSEGYFFFVDRGRDIIKRAGESVSTGEVEAVIKEHPWVADAAVIGVPDAMYDERVKALVIVREGEHLTVEEIIVWCRERLTRFKVPQEVEFRQEFPRTSVGKIQKHLLKAEHAGDELRQLSS